MTNSVDNGPHKLELAAQIGSILFDRDITMGQAAKRFGITQTGVTRLLRRELDEFSVEQLEAFLQELEA